MAYLEVSAFKKLRAFFWALQKSGFNLNKLPTKDNEGMPVDKVYCLNLLHSFPDFQGEQFKDDNFLVKYLSQPGNIKQILDQFTPAQQIELTKVLEEKPTATEFTGEQSGGQEASTVQATGEPAGTTAGGNIPQIPNFSAPSAIHTVQRVNPPGKLVGGKEGGTGTGTAATNKTAGLAGKETPSASHAATAGPPVDNVPKEATEPVKGIKGSNARRFQAPRVPYAVSSAAKNFGSAAQIFTKKGGLRLGSTVSNFLGGVGRAGEGMLGGAIGGGGRFLGRVGIGGLNTFGRISDEVTIRRSLVGKSSTKRVVLLFMGGFLLFSLIAGLLGAITPPGLQKPAPISTGVVGIDYTLPLKDPTIAPVDIRSQILSAFPNAQIQNWDTIIDQTKTHGWNPALVLALWVEESGAQGVPNYTDALGCAPGQPTTDINISLTCLFNNFSSFTNDQFPQFMAKYSSGPASNPFANNPNFPSNLKNWYSKLVLSGPGAITPIITQTAPGALISCPVPGGGISTYSYAERPDIGHCSPGYLAEGRCREDCPGGVGASRRAKAIDVPTHGQDVILPTIDGQLVNWLFKFGYIIELIDGGGDGFVFEARSKTDGTPLGNAWTLDMLHMATTGLNTGVAYPSGTPVGKTAINHVHFTIGKDIGDNTHPGPATTVTDCDPGWIPSDFMCK